MAFVCLLFWHCVIFSILEVFGDYPIQKDDKLFQEVLNISAKQFTDGGYTVFKEPISTDWGIKGFVFMISWHEPEEDNIDDEEGA